MTKRAMSPQERFGVLIDEFAANPAVTPPETGPGARQRFGASGLKVHGKVFAMLWGDQLTLKLPAARVSALLASGDGEPFNPRKDDRVMKEWVTLASRYTGDWLPLAREALDFVAAQAKAKKSGTDQR